jgi:Alkylmercury lyase
MRLWIVGLVGALLGVVSTVETRARWEPWVEAGDCCSSKHGGAAAGRACPVHMVGDEVVASDPAELDKLRRAMRDGVFRPWTELGRAPTPAEIGKRLGLDAQGTDALLDELEACGQAIEFGVLRVPESDLVAVAWPFANVPTGIDVTVEGGKPVHARCAVDALGVSQMLGKPATVEAELRDTGAKLTVSVDGEKLVSADPPDAAVFKGTGCDNMLFFSSRGAAEAYAKDAKITTGKIFALADAVTHGAGIFGPFTKGLTD